MNETARFNDVQQALKNHMSFAELESQEIDFDVFDIDVDLVNAEYSSRYCSIG